MTEQELKIEAKKLGYNVSKKINYEKLVPCSLCGSKKVRRHINLGHTEYYQCHNCGRSSEEKRYNYQARKAWNETNS